MAAGRGVDDRIGDRLAGRHPDLPCDEVEAGHQLGDPVLHLEPGVHLEEVVVALGVEQELDRRGAVEVDAAGHPSRAVEERLASGRVHRRRRRLLDQLLVAPLHAALALAQDRQPAVPVARAAGPRRAGQAPAAAPRRPSRRRRRRAPRVAPKPAHRPPRPPSRPVACRGRRRPAAAFSISGKPSAASSPASPSSATVVPGTIGTPAASAPRRAASLLPSDSRVAAGGPTKTSPAASTARAKPAFSDRKP